MVAETVKCFERLDILVNNAQTITPWRRAENDAIDGFLHRELNTGAFASLWMSQAAFPIMREQRDGLALTYGSESSDCGMRYALSYNTNKEALTGLTRALPNEWGKFNMRGNMIKPGVKSDDFAQLPKSGEEMGRKYEKLREQQQLFATASRYTSRGATCDRQGILPVATKWATNDPYRAAAPRTRGVTLLTRSSVLKRMAPEKKEVMACV
jgi:NAD(P)-dependent dehydrogenase (short-subunit alcohol dehydrogenase family)